MKIPENIKDVVKLQPDYLGFIFYPKSKRFIDKLDSQWVIQHTTQCIRVGVFVNATTEKVLQEAERFKFGLIQLHGDESPSFCQQIKNAGYQVVKAFGVDDDFDFSVLEPYKSYCDYFLFDTKSKAYGGTGQVFNWELLQKYDNQVPLFLSGGLDVDNIQEIKKLDFLNIHAIDINSRFEISPGLKDLQLLNQLNFENIRKKRFG